MLVDQTATAPVPDGLTWPTAHPSLDAGVAAAPPGAIILLAEGTYRPTLAPAGGPSLPRGASFLLTDDMTVQGGFLGLAAGGIGGSVDPDNPDGNPRATILSGDIGVLNDSTDNSYSVVTVRGIAQMDVQVLKDLTVQGGFADDIVNAAPSSPDPIADGSAVFNDNANVEIDGVTFLRNYSARDGGAVFCATNGQGYFGITECGFFGNVEIGRASCRERV